MTSQNAECKMGILSRRTRDSWFVDKNNESLVLLVASPVVESESRAHMKA